MPTLKSPCDASLEQQVVLVRFAAAHLSRQNRTAVVLRFWRGGTDPFRGFGYLASCRQYLASGTFDRHLASVPAQSLDAMCLHLPGLAVHRFTQLQSLSIAIALPRQEPPRNSDLSHVMRRKNHDGKRPVDSTDPCRRRLAHCTERKNHVPTFPVLIS